MHTTLPTPKIGDHGVIGDCRAAALVSKHGSIDWLCWPALRTALEQAHHAFEQLLQYHNDLGLYGEEVDPRTGEALGNFPQAFTHVGLISAALTLAEQERGQRHPPANVGSDVKTVPPEERE